MPPVTHYANDKTGPDVSGQAPSASSRISPLDWPAALKIHSSRVQHAPIVILVVRHKPVPAAVVATPLALRALVEHTRAAALRAFPNRCH
jgi:hypothetical protein